MLANISVRPSAPTYSGTRNLTLDAYLPDECINGTIVYVHGGGWEGGTNDRPPGFRTILAYGYALIAVQYRYATETDGFTMVADVLQGASVGLCVAGEYGVPIDNWYLWGISAGGHLASLAAHIVGDSDSDLPGAPVAVSSWAGPMDLGLYGSLENVRDGLIGDVNRLLDQLTGGDAGTASLLSPIRYVNQNSPPHFFVHGSDDHLVPKEQSTTMAVELKQAGVPAEARIVPNGTHAIPPGHSDEIVATLGFFNRIAASAVADDDEDSGND